MITLETFRPPKRATPTAGFGGGDTDRESRIEAWAAFTDQMAVWAGRPECPSLVTDDPQAGGLRVVSRLGEESEFGMVYWVQFEEEQPGTMKVIPRTAMDHAKRLIREVKVALVASQLVHNGTCENFLLMWPKILRCTDIRFPMIQPTDEGQRLTYRLVQKAYAYGHKEDLLHTHVETKKDRATYRRKAGGTLTPYSLARLLERDGIITEDSTISAVSRAHGNMFFMEMAEETLVQYLNRTMPYITENIVLDIVEGVVRGLQCLANAEPVGYVHNDLHLRNVMVFTTEDEKVIPVIIDFGQASPAEESPELPTNDLSTFLSYLLKMVTSPGDSSLANVLPDLREELDAYKDRMVTAGVRTLDRALVDIQEIREERWRAGVDVGMDEPTIEVEIVYGGRTIFRPLESWTVAQLKEMIDDRFGLLSKNYELLYRGDDEMPDSALLEDYDLSGVDVYVYEISARSGVASKYV